MAGNFFKLKFCARATAPAPPPAPEGVNVFGDLSASLDSEGQPAAYVATSGTSIASGDSAGHFAVSGGKLYVSAAGDAANLSAGSYALTMNDGSTHDITVQPNTYSCSTQAEWNRLIALNGALSGKTIRVRRLPSGGVYTSNTGVLNSLRRIDYGDGTPLTIQGDDRSIPMDGEDVAAATSYPIFDKFTISGARNVIFEYLDTDETNALVKWGMIHTAAWPIGNITIRNCRGRMPPLDPYGDFSNGLGTGDKQFPNAMLINNSGPTAVGLGRIEVTDCYLTWGEQGINMYNGSELITNGNRVAYCFTDGIQANYYALTPGGHGKWTCNDNCVSHPIGKGTDGEGVHWDGIRAVAASGATQDWPIEMGRNVIFHGDCRGDIQDIFLSDFPVGVYFTGSIIGNLTAAASTHVITVSTAKDMVIKANTALGQIDGADYVNTTCRLKIGEVGRAGTVRVEDNLSEAAPIVSQTASRRITTRSRRVGTASGRATTTACRTQ